MGDIFNPYYKSPVDAPRFTDRKPYQAHPLLSWVSPRLRRRRSSTTWSFLPKSWLWRAALALGIFMLIHGGWWRINCNEGSLVERLTTPSGVSVVTNPYTATIVKTVDGRTVTSFSSGMKRTTLSKPRTITKTETTTKTKVVPAAQVTRTATKNKSGTKTKGEEEKKKKAGTETKPKDKKGTQTDAKTAKKAQTAAKSISGKSSKHSVPATDDEPTTDGKPVTSAPEATGDINSSGSWNDWLSSVLGIITEGDDDDEPSAVEKSADVHGSGVGHSSAASDEPSAGDEPSAAEKPTAHGKSEVSDEPEVDDESTTGHKPASGDKAVTGDESATSSPGATIGEKTPETDRSTTHDKPATSASKTPSDEKPPGSWTEWLLNPLASLPFGSNTRDDNKPAKSTPESTSDKQAPVSWRVLWPFNLLPRFSPKTTDNNKPSAGDKPATAQSEKAGNTKAPGSWWGWWSIGMPSFGWPPFGVPSLFSWKTTNKPASSTPKVTSEVLPSSLGLWSFISSKTSSGSKAGVGHEPASSTPKAISALLSYLFGTSTTTDDKSATSTPEATSNVKTPVALRDWLRSNLMSFFGSSTTNDDKLTTVHKSATSTQEATSHVTAPGSRRGLQSYLFGPRTTSYDKLTTVLNSAASSPEAIIDSNADGSQRETRTIASHRQPAAGEKITAGKTTAGEQPATGHSPTTSDDQKADVEPAADTKASSGKTSVSGDEPATPAQEVKAQNKPSTKVAVPWSWHGHLLNKNSEAADQALPSGSSSQAGKSEEHVTAGGTAPASVQGPSEKDSASSSGTAPRPTSTEHQEPEPESSRDDKAKKQTSEPSRLEQDFVRDNRQYDEWEQEVEVSQPTSPNKVAEWFKKIFENKKDISPSAPWSWTANTAKVGWRKFWADNDFSKSFKGDKTTPSPKPTAGGEVQAYLLRIDEAVRDVSTGWAEALVRPFVTFFTLPHAATKNETTHRVAQNWTRLSDDVDMFLDRCRVLLQDTGIRDPYAVPWLKYIRKHGNPGFVDYLDTIDDTAAEAVGSLWRFCYELGKTHKLAKNVVDSLYKRHDLFVDSFNAWGDETVKTLAAIQAANANVTASSKPQPQPQPQPPRELTKKEARDVSLNWVTRSPLAKRDDAYAPTFRALDKEGKTSPPNFPLSHAGRSYVLKTEAHVVAHLLYDALGPRAAFLSDSLDEVRDVVFGYDSHMSGIQDLQDVLHAWFDEIWELEPCAPVDPRSRVSTDALSWLTDKLSPMPPSLNRHKGMFVAKKARPFVKEMFDDLRHARHTVARLASHDTTEPLAAFTGGTVFWTAARAADQFRLELARLSNRDFIVPVADVGPALDKHVAWNQGQEQEQEQEQEQDQEQGQGQGSKRAGNGDRALYMEPAAVLAPKIRSSFDVFRRVSKTLHLGSKTEP